MKNFIVLLVLFSVSFVCFADNGEGSTKNGVVQLQELEKVLSPDALKFTDPFAAQMLTKKAFKLCFANAVTLGKELRSTAGLLSKDGRVVVDQRTNILWILDRQKNIRAIANLVKSLDVSVPQVMINARLVSVDTEYLRELGVQFGTVTKAEGVLSGGNQMQAGQFNLAIAHLGSGVTLDMRLSALENKGVANIISQPRLITLNRQTAHIQSGEEIPYQEKTGQGDTSVAFKKAVLGLKVTPAIVAHNKLLLSIVVNQDKVSNLTVDGVPAISTREIKTQVLVRNRRTIVLGGIFERQKSKRVVRIPFLGSLPILGMLFRHDEIDNSKRELLIFITPQIIRG